MNGVMDWFSSELQLAWPPKEPMEIVITCALTPLVWSYLTCIYDWDPECYGFDLVHSLEITMPSSQPMSEPEPADLQWSGQKIRLAMDFNLLMCYGITSLSILYKLVWGYIASYIIKTSGSESRGQEEAACIRVFRPMRPLQWVICTDGRSKVLKCCSSAAITAIA